MTNLSKGLMGIPNIEFGELTNFFCESKILLSYLLLRTLHEARNTKNQFPVEVVLEAREWINSDQEHYETGDAFTFFEVCEYLDLDMIRVRAAILVLSAEKKITIRTF